MQLVTTLGNLSLPDCRMALWQQLYSERPLTPIPTPGACLSNDGAQHSFYLLLSTLPSAQRPTFCSASYLLLSVLPSAQRPTFSLIVFAHLTPSATVRYQLPSSTSTPICSSTSPAPSHLATFAMPSYSPTQWLLTFHATACTLLISALYGMRFSLTLSLARRLQAGLVIGPIMLTFHA
uniref:Uncharacterized protein n=1 Tax=Ustilago esculenta TaxID=185366 RepID=A0A481SFQ3_9BASI|nr:hypothetical protein UEMT_2031 [Ustilago esculenta]